MTQPTPEQQPPATPEVDKAFTQADVDRIVAERVKRAKPADYDELKAAAKRLAEIEAANATDLEKAVATARREVEDATRKAVTSEYGQRIARAEFLAAAAKRNAEHDAATILDDLNLARYVGEDGEPNTKEIAAAVERLIPAPAADPRPKGNADLGPRPAPPTPTDGSPRSLIAAGIAASDASKR